MAKKSKKNLTKILGLIPALLFIGAIVMFVLPFFKSESSLTYIITTSGSETIKGFSYAFGGETDILTVINTVYSPSTGTVVGAPLALISFIITCVGIVLSLFAYFAEKNSKKLFTLLVFAIGIAACVLLFISPSSFFTANEIDEAVRQYYQVQYGLVLSAVLSGLSGIFSGYLLFRK